MIANSLTSSPKLLTAGTRYNKRVVECRVGLVLLCLKLGLIKSPTEKRFATFYELQKHLKLDFTHMANLVKKWMKKEPYTEADIQTTLGCPLLDIVKDIPNHDLVLSSNKEYFLYKYPLSITMVVVHATCSTRRRECTSSARSAIRASAQDSWRRWAN